MVSLYLTTQDKYNSAGIFGPLIAPYEGNVTALYNNVKGRQPVMGGPFLSNFSAKNTIFFWFGLDRATKN